MKKVIAILLACALVFSLSLTVFASESPSGDEDEITIEVITEDDVEVAVPEISGYSVATIVDITAPDGTTSVTVSVDGVTADSTIVVYHLVDGSWVVVDATPGDGTVTITSDSFSPFAIYVLDSDDSDDSDDDTESPTTGESNMMLFVAAFAVLAAAGLAVSAKKVRG